VGYLIPLVLLLAFIWLLLIRPQRRRHIAQQAMLDRIEVGDEILTVGGVYATVEAVRDEELQVEIAPGTSVRLDKRAVAAVMAEEEPDEELDEAPEEELEKEPEEELEKAEAPKQISAGES
jgi:preprotein translocase subunit YajC